jgi:hypothetical protein
MASLTNFMENKLLGHALKIITMPVNPEIWVGCGLGDQTVPQEDGTGFYEPTATGAPPAPGVPDPGTNYYRVSLNPSTNNWYTPGGGAGNTEDRVTSNKQVIQFNQADPNGWGLVKYWGLFETDTTPTPFGWGTVNDPNGRIVAALDQPFFSVGSLNIALFPSPASGGFHNFLANGLLKHLFTGVAFSNAYTVYMTMSDSTLAMGDDLLMSALQANEQNMPGLVRQQYTPTDWQPIPIVDGTVNNAIEITFGPAQGDWPNTAGSIVLTTDVTAGSILMWAKCITMPETLDGQVIRWAPGNLILGLD